MSETTASGPRVDTRTGADRTVDGPAPGTRSTDAGRVADVLPLHRGPAPAAVELAAGVVCWRDAPGDHGRRDGDPERTVEVLLVHRPRYDDWSFPKGKVEPGETLPECAVREAAEETGARVRLGRPLPTVRYVLPDGRDKEVAFWAARALSAPGRPSRRKEVDEVAWVPARTARKRLAHATDLALLDALLDLARQRRLATYPLLVVRHATARPRQAWTHADADRPLVAAGRRQALSLASMLPCWAPEYVLSSPWQRCTETLAPFAAATGARIRTKGGLSEDGYQRDPRKAARHTRALVAREQSTVLCTHRPVLPSVMAAIADLVEADLRDDLPAEEPFLEPAEILVAHLRHRGGKPVVVALERHAPPR